MADDLVRPEQYGVVGQEAGLSGYDLARFARVLRVRRPQGISREELATWAVRFRDHTEWEYLSADGRRAALETDGLAISRNTVGPLSHAHPHHFYKEDQVARILSKGQTPIKHHGGLCGPECARAHRVHTHAVGQRAHQPRRER